MQGEQELIIQWENLPVYNTIMALAAGAALISFAKMSRDMINKTKINPSGWALNLGVIGVILTTTGLHMSLTWPLAPNFPFDNIVFGEPSLALGLVTLAMAYYFWKEKKPIVASDQPITYVSKDLRHLRFVLYGLGLALIAIGFAGVIYKLFAAPPQEPISGLLADYPLIESIFISALWAAIGVSALIIPGILSDFADNKLSPTVKVKATFSLIKYCGWALLLFGAMNYFTHIGLIVNTMPG
ncbi:MAG: DUF981 domain-containing protein [Gracilimonas sp.]|uniref:DUF981 family protein n=1 Tax=Gracilimonas sp. TaxID=1974203 RepID=UPI0037518F41|nr:DUF981 domain-containing protein [Gracilimonas sp.]